MAPVSMSVSELRCAATDPEWLKLWIAGGSPGVRDFPSGPSAKVYGSTFHALARKLTEYLRQRPEAKADSHDALLDCVYTLGANDLLTKLLDDGEIESAAAVTTALHGLCERLLELGRRHRFADLFIAAEYKLSDVALETPAGNLFVSGIIDSIRRGERGAIEIVDYKLSAGAALDKELIQLALYRRLLLAQDPGLNPSGVLEYFLPTTRTTEVTTGELDAAYASHVAPILAELVASRRTTVRPEVRSSTSETSAPMAAEATTGKRVATSKSASSGASAPRTTGAARELCLGRSRGFRAEPVQLALPDLCRHVAVIGGSGSGKTTLAMALVERALLAGVPVMLVDRKGDLARYADPSAWEAASDSEQSASRRELRDRIDVALYTPGHSGGRPLRLPLITGVEDVADRDSQQLLRAGAIGLGDMLRLGHGQADEAKRSILKQTLETLCAASGQATFRDVLGLLERPDPDFMQQLGVLGRQVERLVIQLKSFELMNQELVSEVGEPIDIAAMFGLNGGATRDSVRLSIVNTRFFDGDSAALFWVSQLLGALNRFCARNPSGTLQALVLFDEADIYLPATRSPVTKAPLESLLKRARSAGVGVILCTQSPGDFDYKCRENVLTWLVGRVKEERALEKLKPLASAVSIDAAAAFPKQTVGQFHMLTESGARAFSAERSLLATEQLSERRILELARASARA